MRKVNVPVMGHLLFLFMTIEKSKCSCDGAFTFFIYDNREK